MHLPLDEVPCALPDSRGSSSSGALAAWRQQPLRMGGGARAWSAIAGAEGSPSVPVRHMLG